MNYTDIAVKALKAIQKNGSECLIIRESSEIYNEEKNEYEKVTQTYTGYALENDFDIKNIDRTNVEAGDLILMASFGEKPVIGDKIKFGGNEYVILESKPFAPDGITVMYYTIHAR